MAYLTAAEVRNVVFRKPPLGKRGYDEESVDKFLTQVERTFVGLTAELEALRAQLGTNTPSAGATAPAGGELGWLAADLDQIKVRLARIEAALAARGVV